MPCILQGGGGGRRCPFVEINKWSGRLEFLGKGGLVMREADLAVSLGVSRDRMRVLREESLSEGVHFEREKNGGAVVLTPKGIAELDRVMQGEVGGLDVATVDVEVAGLPVNRRVVVGEKKGGGRVTVKVGNSEFLTVGMVLLGCVPVAGATDLYEFTGRVPRRRVPRNQTTLPAAQNTSP